MSASQTGIAAIGMLLAGWLGATGVQAQTGPGCVSPSVWLKGNAGVTLSGTTVTGWASQTGTVTMSPGAVAGAPSLPIGVKAASTNFNPGLTFNNVNWGNAALRTYMDYAPTGIINKSDGTVYVVANPSVASANAHLVGWYTDGNYPGLAMTGNRPFFYTAGSSFAYGAPAGSLKNNEPFMLGTSWANSASGYLSPNPDVRFNGNSDVSTLMLNVNIAASVDTPFRLGADTDWGGLTGEMLEVLVFENPLTIPQKQRVESYLAIKYGLTKADNYLAGNAATIWNTTTNAGYTNSIVGIGRDDCQQLNQKQSKSTNGAALVTLGNGTGIAATNALNANTFTSDQSFEVIGDNGAPANYATTYASSFTAVAPVYAMSRIWKVQETGTVGPITISIPGSGNSTYLLVRTTNATFTSNSGTTEILMTPDGNGNLTAQVNLTDGQFFTFAKPIFAPGCVATGLDFWFDPAVNVTKVGSTTVTAWGDRDGGGNNPLVTQTTTSLQPTYAPGDAASNFNPYINFAGNTRLNQNVTGSNYALSHTTFGVVNNYTFKTDYTHFIRFSDADNADGGTHNWGLGHTLDGQTNVGIHYILAPFPFGTGGAASAYNRWNTNRTIPIGQSLLYGAMIDAVGGSSIVNQNGNESTLSGSTDLTKLSPNRAATYLTIGGGNAYGMNDNKTSEIIHYSRTLTLNERQRVDTYLGIKHGLTLEHNYLAGNSAVVYDVSSYSANVFGIGRDDCQQLVQKQSQSVNSTAKMTIGLSGTIASDNASNPGSFTVDTAFLVIGDNGGTGTSSFSSTTAACPVPPLVDKYTNLAYKVTETNSVSAVFIKVDVSGYGFNPVYPLYMQVFSDAAFTNLIASVPMSFSGSTATTNYDFPASSTSYVRFAGNTTSLANICSAPQTQTFHWNKWYYGDKTKTIVGNFGLNASLVNPVMSVSITDGTTDANVLLYKPTVNWWPVFDGLGIFIPRYDDNSASQQGSVVTTQMSFFAQSSLGVASTSAVAAQTVDFVLRDIDGYVGGKDVVKVYGKLGAAIVYPKITKNNLYPTLASTALTINQATGTITGGPLPWDLTVLGDAYVTFDSPVEQVFVEYTKQNTYGFKVYNDLRIGEVNVTCKAPTPRAALADNVYIYKQATPNIQKTNEPVSYKFTIQNTACNNKTIDFTDNLPGGLTFADSTLTTSLAYTSLNAYGNAQNLTIGSLIVPPGTSYLYARVKGTTQGVYNNQATYTVQGGTGTTLLSDDPGQTGTTFQPTPLTLIQNDPDAQLAVTKAVSKTTTGQNTAVTYSFTVSSANSASAVQTTFQDVLPGELTFVAGSLSGLSSTYTSSTAVATYGGTPTLSMRNLTVPAGGSVSFSIQANVNSYTLGAVARNVATASPDPLSGFRIKAVNSNMVSTTITNPPSVTINSPLNNTQTSLTPTISGTATPGALVTITGPGNATLCSTTATTGGSYSCTLSTLTAGAQTLTAVATNASGTSTPATVSLTAVAPPTVAITSPAPGAALSSSNPPISGTATPGASVTVAGGTGAPCVTTASSTGSWTCTTLNFSSGPQTVSATAGNVGGTSPTATTNFSVAAPLTVNTMPASNSTTVNTPVSGSAAAAITPGGGTQPLVYSAFNPTSGSATSATAISTPHGTATIDPVTGIYSYTPTAGYSGTDAIGIKVCDSSTPTPQCASSIIPITIAAPASASGTLDCSSAQIVGIMAGTAGNGVLKLNLNVTTTGSYSVSLSGSGLSANPSPYITSASSTGSKTVYVPLTYTGAAFDASTTILVAGFGTCTVNMTAVTPKTVSTSVLNLGPACSPATAATLSK